MIFMIFLVFSYSNQYYIKLKENSQYITNQSNAGTTSDINSAGKFTIERISGGDEVIIKEADGSVFDMRGNGKELMLYGIIHRHSNQRFTIRLEGYRDYSIRSDNGQCLQHDSGSSSIYRTTCSYNNNQFFDFIEIEKHGSNKEIEELKRSIENLMNTIQSSVASKSQLNDLINKEKGANRKELEKFEKGLENIKKMIESTVATKKQLNEIKCEIEHTLNTKSQITDLINKTNKNKNIICSINRSLKKHIRCKDTRDSKYSSRRRPSY
ncbi:hypothetical protein SLOPH_1767 [Spraguea lophii 42_110]|uniref:Uncharacterized protein n=1 Tax=Spraguea lophii (strain 42_110) TaxID=1358809 RepID=S7XK85_SPRLO|nr:hypothetical protein SLOPH_1767 [Spraguea lophii 42_110]